MATFIHTCEYTGEQTEFVDAVSIVYRYLPNGAIQFCTKDEKAEKIYGLSRRRQEEYTLKEFEEDMFFNSISAENAEAIKKVLFK